MFYNDKPVDWLLDHVVATKVCKPDQVSDLDFDFDFDILQKLTAANAFLEHG